MWGKTGVSFSQVCPDEIIIIMWEPWKERESIYEVYCIPCPRRNPFRVVPAINPWVLLLLPLLRWGNWGVFFSLGQHLNEAMWSWPSDQSVQQGKMQWNLWKVHQPISASARVTGWEGQFIFTLKRPRTNSSRPGSEPGSTLQGLWDPAGPQFPSVKCQKWSYWLQSVVRMAGSNTH